MKSSKYLILIPLAFFLLFIWYPTRDTSNKRYTEPVEVENVPSKLVNEADYPIETSEKIDELNHKILTEGEGDRVVESGNRITVNYRGWLAKDGSIFDQSFIRGNDGYELSIGFGNVIAGWDEGIVGMKLGEVRRIYIPSEKGYAERGSGEAIPANADLIFDVELLAFN